MTPTRNTLTIERINLPKPDTHCFDDDTKSDVWSYSRELVISTVLAHIDKLEAEVERLRKDEERKPMTDKDIVRIYGLSKSTTDFARNIELFIAEGTP